MSENSRRNRNLVIGLITVLVAALAVVVVIGTRDDNQVVIGTVLPLSGPHAHYSLGPRNAIDLAISERTDDEFPNPITAVHEDSQLKPATGRIAINKLISVHGVPVVIGAAGSNVTKVIGPIAQNHSVVLITPASTAGELSDIGNFFFRTIAVDSHEGAYMAKFVYGRGVRRSGCSP